MRSLPLLALLWGSAFAGTEWETISLKEPVPAKCVLAQGSSVWVGDAGGLRVSRNEGETWSTVTSLPGSDTVYALYSKGDVLFAARTGAIYRSADSGSTWQRTPGDSLQSTGGRFQAHGDSLFFFANRYPPYWVLLSLDEGRSWKFLEYASEEADSTFADPEPGVRIRLHFGTLSQSTDSGKTWNDLPISLPTGGTTSLAAADGWIYATVGLGSTIRGRAKTGEWRILEPAMRDALPTELAASGHNLCTVTVTGIWCSRDGGLHFGFMGVNPFPIARRDPSTYNFKRNIQLGVDSQRLYVGSVDFNAPDYLWSRSLDDSGTWGKLKYLSEGTAVSMVMAVREGLLALLTDVGLASAPRRSRILSRDRGATFNREYVVANDLNNRRAASVEKSIWAVSAGGSFTPLHICLSADSGYDWNSHRAPGQALNSLAVTDSSLYAVDTDSLKLWRYGFVDTTWTYLPEAGKAGAVAASDSILYLISDGKIRKRNLYPGMTTAVRSLPEKSRKGPFVPRRGRIVFPNGSLNRDALGKRAAPARPIPVPREDSRAWSSTQAPNP